MSNEAQSQSSETQTTGTEVGQGTTPLADSSTQQPQAASGTQGQTPSDSASTDLGTAEPEKGLETDLGAEGDAAGEGEKPPVPEFFGAPKNEDGTPKDYDAFTLPEGSVANPELQTSFSAVAKELGLNQAGAQKLVDYKTELDRAQIRAWGEHVATLRTTAKADAEIGGANYDTSVQLGRQVISKFGGNPQQVAELRKVMNDYGVGAHPAMIRFFRNIGKATGETPTGGNGGSGGAADRPLHELFYGDKSRSQQGT